MSSLPLLLHASFQDVQVSRRKGRKTISLARLGQFKRPTYLAQLCRSLSLFCLLFHISTLFSSRCLSCSTLTLPSGSKCSRISGLIDTKTLLGSKKYITNLTDFIHSKNEVRKKIRRLQICILLLLLLLIFISVVWWTLSGGLSSMRCLLYIVIQSRRETSCGYLQEGHGYSCRLPALVCNSHHVDFRSSAKKSHCVNSIRHPRKKKQRGKGSLSTCDQHFVMNCQIHNQSWKGSASALASMPWLLRGEKRRHLTSVTVPKKKRYRT